MKKLRKYTKTKAVKAIARERVGTPKGTRVVPDKTLRPKPKHKKQVGEEE